MACARDLKGESHHIVAVIGDGSLTGGMSFEAMNHAGQKGSRLIVALNDNGMFISHRVGRPRLVFEPDQNAPGVQ
jgi:1-deoxy-D-xylulose-5-phosphate synthase